MKTLFLTLLSVWYTLSCSAQVVIQGGIIFKMANNVTVVIKDMNLVNNGSIDQPIGGGKFVFSGVADNTLAGSSITTFDKIEIAKGPGTKLLLGQNVQITSSILFTSGLIDLTDRLVQLKSGATLNGESESSKIMSSSNGYVFVTSVLNAPSSLNPGNMGAIITSTQNMGTTTIRRRHVAQTLTGDNSGINRYYEIYPTNNTALNATLRLNYLDTELNGLNEATLALWKNNGAWSHQGFTNRSTSANYVEKDGISDFSTWTLGASANPLPVRLVSFKADSPENQNIVLNWKTVSETAFWKFELERSTEPRMGFSYLASISSRNLNSGDTYQYTDTSVLPGKIYYYRLKMIDTDNSFAFSKIASAQISDVNNLYIYPNPATTFFDVTGSLPVQRIRLVDLSGREILNQTYPGSSKTETLQLKPTPQGIYLLQVTAPNGYQQLKKVFIAQ